MGIFSIALQAALGFAKAVISAKKGNLKTSVSLTKKTKDGKTTLKSMDELVYEVVQSAYGNYIRGKTTTMARFVGHPAAAMSPQEQIKQLMEAGARPIDFAIVTITTEFLSQKRDKEKTIEINQKNIEKRLNVSKPIQDLGVIWNRFWGYEDNAPIAGQPIYDTIELFHNTKESLNDFSDYLEEMISRVSKRTKNALVESVEEDAPQFLKGFVGKPIEDKELNFGGKIGSVMGGALIDGLGGSVEGCLIMITSPIDTWKDFQALGELTDEEIVEMSKENAKKWMNLPEQEKWRSGGEKAEQIIEILFAAKKILNTHSAKNLGDSRKETVKTNDIDTASVKEKTSTEDMVESEHFNPLEREKNKSLDKGLEKNTTPETVKEEQKNKNLQRSAENKEEVISDKDTNVVAKERDSAFTITRQNSYRQTGSGVQITDAVKKTEVKDVKEKIDGKGESGTLEFSRATVHSVDKIKPSLPEGSKPLGNYADASKRTYLRQNETADLFASKGYKVEMLDEIFNGNGYGLKETANPDFLIEGKVFDCYSPSAGAKMETIINEIRSKTKNQTPNIILNLDDYQGSMDKLIELIKRKATPKGDLKRLEDLKIVKGGEIFDIFD